MSIYSPTARFDTAVALSDDQLRKIAPSIFAVEAHESRSEKFRPIPTIEILNGLRQEGFFPVAVKQSKTRDPGKRDYTKHLIRFRRFDNVEAYKVGDTVAELLMKNANDGTSKYDLFAGLFRIQCLNSLVSASGDIDSVKVMHKGQDVQQKVIEGSYRVLENAKLALAAPQDWSGIKLSRDAAMVMAETAHQIRFEDAEGNVKTPIQASQLLIPRRQADTSADLWTGFNVIQENCIRGGLSATGRGSNGRLRQFTTKNVNGIDQDIRINRALFTMAAKMADILKPAA